MADDPIEPTEPVVDPSAVVADLVKPTDTPADPPPEWFISDGVKGEGIAPEWYKADKYKTVSDQAKAYKDLEGSFGAFTGAPEKYEFNLSEGVKEKGIEIAADDPMVEAAMEYAKSKNMNQEGLDGMVDLYVQVKLAEQTLQKEFEDKEWKELGDNAKGRTDNLASWASANLSTDLQDGFNSMARTADNVRAMEALVAKSRPGALNPDIITPSGMPTREEVTKMQFEKDDNGQRRTQTDPEFKKRYIAMRDQVYGMGEHNQTIG